MSEVNPILVAIVLFLLVAFVFLLGRHTNGDKTRGEKACPRCGGLRTRTKMVRGVGEHESCFHYRVTCQGCGYREVIGGYRSDDE